LKLAVASLIRNEIDIIGPYLQHLDALFDYAVLMDHHSIDGTDRVMAQACARRPGWELWHVEPVGFHQFAFCEFAMHHLFRHTDTDIVVLLDADEFLAVPDRAALEANLARLTDPDRIGRLHWRNLVPERFDTRAILPREPIWRAPNLTAVDKMVIPRRFHLRHGREVHIAPGNHYLHYDSETHVPSHAVGEILHLPIRSHEQIKGKVLAAVFAVLQLVTRAPGQSWHRFDLLWRIADGALRDEDLIGIAAHYSEAGVQGTKPMSYSELAAGGYTLTALDVAFGRPLPPVTEPLSIDPVRLVATILRQFQPEDIRTNTLLLDGDRLRFASQVSQP
jgi:glycosyl transferase family 2